MRLKQTRIRDTKKLLSNVKPGETFVLGIEIDDEIEKILDAIAKNVEIGFDYLIFPDPELGIMSKRNAVGEFIPQKNLPKEVAYRAQEWELTDWGGYLHSGVSYVPYQRYQRIFNAPQELRIGLVETNRNQQIVIVNKEMINDPGNRESIIFGANLMLEIFGEVDTYLVNKDSGIILSQNMNCVNWEILPRGQQIWEHVRNRTQSKVSSSELQLMSISLN
jgi:predicted transcriptional regulator